MVVTAAHCLAKHLGLYRVQIGKFDLGLNEAGTETIVVKGFWQHLYYNPTTIRNDLGIIILNRYSGIRPIPYNVGGLNPSGTAIGWGAVRYQGSMIRRLREVNLAVQADATCRALSNYVARETFCAGNSSYGTCQGDSGGPFVMNGILAGITSYGQRGCNGYSYFVNVSYYQSYIKTVIVNSRSGSASRPEAELNEAGEAKGLSGETMNLIGGVGIGMGAMAFVVAGVLYKKSRSN